MSLITDPGLINAEPGVHVLVVSVGRYPFLMGGDEAEALPDHGQLGQLASPVPSAETFVQWLMTEFRPCSVPLRSIEILCSPGGAFYDFTGKAVEVESPDMSNVKRAIKSWAARGDTSPDSILMFYFCGHGVSSGDIHSLLLENFGDDHDDPFNNGAIDIGGLMDGLRGKQATQQLFFLDACRTFDNAAFKKFGDIRGQPIISHAAFARLDVVEQAALWATRLGSLAYGIPGQPSVFTRAMLHAMNGSGALQDETDGSWVIGPEMLKIGINFIIRRHLGSELTQYAALERMVANIPIHSLIDGPSVPVSVQCKPAERNISAAFRCSSGASRAVGTPEPWHLDLRLDSYSFEAEFEDIGRKSKNATPHPPFSIVSIDTTI